MKPKSNPFVRSLALATLCLTLGQAAHAAALTWTGGPGDWENGQVGGWSAAWNNTTPDTGTFNGAGGTVSVKSDIVTAVGTATVGGVHFAAGNYTLQSDSASLVRNISIGTTAVAVGYVSVAPGVTTTIGDRVKLRKQGSGNGDLRIRGGGTLIVGSGTSGGNASLDTTNATNTSFIEDGGKLVVTTGGTAAFGTSFVVGSLAAGASMEVTGGAVTIGNSSSNLVMGNGGVTSNVSFKMTSGSLTFTNVTNNTTNGALRIGGNAAGNTTGVVDLEGGTFSANRIWENTTGTVNSTLNLHGGTVRALYADTTDFLSVDNIFVKANGATIDSNGRNIGISKALQTDLVSTGGGLTKTGAGTLTLSGANTYTGPTIINGGKLAIAAPYSAITSTTVNADARLSVTTGATASTVPSVTVNTNGGFEVNTGNYNASTLAGITTPTFNANGNYVVDITGTNIPVGPITVLSYTTKAGTGTPSLGNRPPGVEGTVTDTGSAIVINVTSPQVPSIVWSAGTGDWDTSTANWTGATYTEGAIVTFPEITGDNTVTLTAARSPYSVAITNASTSTYTFSGSGIAGSGTVTKSGTGTATFANANSYSGTTSVQGGTLVLQASRTVAGAGTTVSDGATLALDGGVDMPAEPLSLTGQGVGNNGVLRSLSGDNIWNGAITSAGILRVTSVLGSLTFNDAITLPAPGTNFQFVLQGDGDITVNGSIGDSLSGASPLTSGGVGTGTRTLSAANTYTGATNVNGGKLVLTHEDALGSTVGGTTVAGDTFGGGSLVLSGGLTGLNIDGETLTLAGRQGTTIDNPHLINESGNNTWTGTVTFNVGGNDYNIESQADLLTMAGQITGGTTTGNRNLKLTGDGNGEISGAIINGTSTATVQVTKRGPGTWTLSGTNLYSGNTTIEDGTLALSSTGQMRFVPTTNGLNNSVGGTGTFTADGKFLLDLAGADTTAGNEWLLVNVTDLTESYGSNFSVTSSAGDLTETSPGVWKITDSGKTWTFTESTGTLGVADAAGYASWASTNAGGETADLDFDKDGVDNGVEYFLNAPAGFTKSPTTFTGNTATWTNGGNIPSGDYGTQFVIQTSTDLVGWTDVLITDTNLNNQAGSVAYTLNGTGKQFVRLVVTPN